MNDRRDRSTDALEADLRAFAHRAAPEPPPQLLDEVLRATQTLPQRARWSLASWPGLAAVAATVVLAVAIGAGAGLPQRIASLISSPTAGPHASGSSVIRSSATPAPDGSPSASASFELVSDPDLFPGGLSAVVAQPGLVVAGGQTCTADAQCAAAMWHSADGRSWDPPEALPGGADDGVGAIAVGAAGWVAIGSYHAWFSPDGTSWTQAEGDFTHGLADGGPSYQAEGGCCAAQLIAVAPVNGGFVAVGGVACFKCSGRAAVWTSPDGHAWNRLAYTPAFGASAMSSMTVLQSGRIVAVGGHSAWTSDDAGKTWSLHAHAFAELASRVVTDGTRLTALKGVGGLQDVGTIWTSEDGVTWVAEARPELDRSEITAASELGGVIYIATQYRAGVTTRELRMYRLDGNGPLERIGVEPGAAGGAHDLIWSIAPLDAGLVAVGSTVTTAPNGQQPAGVWLLPSLPEVTDPAIRVVCQLDRSCDDLVKPVIDEVAAGGREPIAVTFMDGYLCLNDPFHPIFCPFAGPLQGEQTFIGSAVVELAQTQERAFLNLWSRSDGSIDFATKILAPPPSSSAGPSSAR